MATQFPSQTSASGEWSLKKIKRNLQGANFPTFPDAPTIGTATAGNAQASVTFTAPSNTGGASITSYTITSSPGNIIATGSSSPIVVTGLTNGTAYTFNAKATTFISGPVSSASNSVTPLVNAWNEAGTGSTTTALKSNLLYVGVGNTVYQWYNAAPLVQANSNPKSTSGLNVPTNYSGGSYISGSNAGMTTTAPSKFNSSDGYGSNSFRSAKTSAVNLKNSWSGTPNPGIACFWFYNGEGGMHLIGNGDCSTRYLIQNNYPTSSAWVWVVIDLVNNIMYWDNVSQGNAGGSYTNLYCAFYMGWPDSNTIDAYYHDYRVYQYDSANHTAMVNALKPIPTTAYYVGGV